MTPDVDQVKQTILSIRSDKYQLTPERIDNIIRSIRLLDKVPTAKLESTEAIFARFLVRVHDMAYQLITRHRFSTLASTAPCGEGLTAIRVLGLPILGNYMHYLAQILPPGEMSELAWKFYDLCKNYIISSNALYLAKVNNLADKQDKLDEMLAATWALSGFVNDNAKALAELYSFINNDPYFNVEDSSRFINHIINSMVVPVVKMEGKMPTYHLDDETIQQEVDMLLPGSENDDIEVDLFLNPISTFFSQLKMAVPPEA
jgi:hypothetical protein